MKTPILGSSYVARSVNAADNRMVNLFPEIIPEGGKEPAFLIRAPGLTLVVQVGSGPIRGIKRVKSILYVVSGNKLYKVDTSYIVTEIGTVTGSGQVSMSDNGIQLFIACNPDGFIYNLNTLVFSQITDSNFPGAVTVDFIDNYFVFNEPNSQKLWITELLDGTSIDALDFASAEGLPDDIVGLIVDHRELWVFGTESTEIWYNAGTSDFPLQRIQGAFNEIGCVAPYSISKLDNSVIWLGSDNRGQGIVYRANGYIGQRISTHSVEWKIQQYSTLSDAVSYSYQQDGHSFYVITFPSGNATWVYDISTNSWHERASFSNGSFGRHRSNCQAFFNDKILLGDYENGNIYNFDLDNYTDNSSIQRWLRTWRALPTGTNNLKRTINHSLQLDCESGVGLNSGQGDDSQIILRWSDDGGHTWSNEHWSSIGKIGKYGYRAIWRRLGSTSKIRDRIFEISGSDPVKIIINGAVLDVEEINKS